MKTNLSNLMNIVVEEERKLSAYGYELKEITRWKNNPRSTS